MKAKLLVCIMLFSLFCFASDSLAANYPLEIINVEEVGANNRIRFAYPGIEYKVVIAAEGGAYPFVWELTSAPQGMMIDNHKGIITWTPSANGTSNVSVKVTDKEGNTDSELYSITVTDSTDRFIFIDDNATGTKTGSITQPYASLSEIWGTNHGGKIVYFREGTYTLPHTNDEIRHASKTVIKAVTPFSYIGYPNETIAIDEESNPAITDNGDGLGNYPGYLFAWSINDVYFANLTFYNIYYYALSNGGGDYATIYECRFKNAYTSNITNNQSYINYILGNTADYNLITNNIFEGPITGGTNFNEVETYSSIHALIQNNHFTNSATRGAFFKDGTYFSTVRDNLFENCPISFGVYGQSGSNNNEICFNNFRNSSTYDIQFDLAPNSNTDPTYLYRNTCSGNIQVRNGDGILNIGLSFYNNAIQNSYVDSGNIGENVFYRNKVYFRYVTIENYADMSFVNNLQGSSGLVDSNGLLINRSQVGTYGHEIADSEYWGNSSSDTTAPSIPSGLSVS